MAKKIEVYSSDSCRFCVKLKDWLTKKKIDFINHDINEEQARNFLIEKNIVGIPFVIIIDTETGEQTEINGFDPYKLEEILN